MNEAERAILPLLSGWLDGELTLEETHRVEEALERSAALRAVVDEWRSVDLSIHEQNPLRSEAEWEALALRVEGAIAADSSPGAALSQDSADLGTTRHSPSWLERCQAWFAPRRWAVGGTGALAAVVLLVLLWPHSDEWLKSTGVLKKEVTPVVEQPIVAESETPPVSVEEKMQGSQLPTAGRSKGDIIELGLPPTLDEKKSQADSQSDAPTTPPARLTSPRAPEARMRKDDADQSAPTAPLSMPPQPTPPAPQEGRVDRQFMALQSHDGWLAQTNHQLQAALETRNRDDLQGVLTEIERHRVESPADANSVAFLELAVRARGESLRLFPDAEGNDNACLAIRADYAAFQKIADQAIQESPEGMLVGDLVREVCPE